MASMVSMLLRKLSGKRTAAENRRSVVTDFSSFEKPSTPVFQINFPKSKNLRSQKSSLLYDSCFFKVSLHCSF
jgi:hypothetical protein